MVSNKQDRFITWNVIKSKEPEFKKSQKGKGLRVTGEERRLLKRKERKGKERKGKERKGKERKGKERKRNMGSMTSL